MRSDAANILPHSGNRKMEKYHTLAPPWSAAGFAMSILRAYAKYNAWATDQLWRGCKCHASLLLSPQAPQGLFATSIHGTFTHILLADALWYYRITKTYPRYIYGVFGLKEELALSRRLDTLWTSDNTTWHTILNSSDEVETLMKEQGSMWIKLLDSYSDSFLNTSNISYPDTAGNIQTQQLDHALLHVFNHSTHHRGQITAVLSSHSLTIPPLDFTYYMSSVTSASKIDRPSFNDGMMI